MIATAPATAQASWANVPFGEFLQLLRRNGFAVGLQHYARMMTLLDTLGPDTSPVRVRSVLAPVFATTPDQQERFYKLFDQWFPVFVATSPDGVRAAVTGDGADGPVPDPQSRRGRVKPGRRYLPALVAVAVIALIATAVWVGTRPEPVAVPADLPTPVAPQATRPVPAPVVTPLPVIVEEGPAPERQVNWQAIRVGAALLILLGFVANEWRHYRRRLMVLERQRRERPPLVWPIRIEAASTPLVESSEFLTAARRLRERQTGDRERLDIEATIAATIRALGRPVMHYVKETRPPDYLILIERASARDHQAKLYLHLIEHLVAEGVHATVYWCEEDPRICDPVIDGPTATLVELRHKFPSHRLLLFGSGDGLINPISGRRKSWVSDTLSWPDRALLTPEPPESWGAREVALAGHLMVLPGTLGGLQAAIDHFQIPSRSELARRRHRGSHVPEPDAKEGVRALKSYLGPKGLQWVCACAVYPDLQWNLTLHLGMMPELGGAIDDELLAKLVRLSWFRQGTIPDESRAVLLRVIEPAVERAARRAIIALLERNPAPPESIASSRFELDLVVQKFALDSRTRSRRRDLAKVARKAPRERVLTELAVLRLTEGDPGSPVAMRLPERLRDVFFQSGVSVLGLTSGARSVVAMALVAGVLVVGPGRDLPMPEPEPEVAQDSSTANPSARVEVTATRDTAPAPKADALATDSAPTTVVSRPADSATANPTAPPTLVDTATQRPNVQPTAAASPPPVARDPQVGVVRVGSSTPNASLFIGGTFSRTLSTIQPVTVPAAEPVDVSIRVSGCQSWDSTVTVAANDTVTIGMRATACATPAPDRAELDRLIAQATGIASSRLSGPWTAVDNKAPSTSFGSLPTRQRLANAIRDTPPVRADVSSLQARGPLDAAVTPDSVFISGSIRFTWRGSFGPNEQVTANIEAAFARLPSGLQLQRLVIR